MFLVPESGLFVDAKSHVPTISEPVQAIVSVPLCINSFAFPAASLEKFLFMSIP